MLVVQALDKVGRGDVIIIMMTQDMWVGEPIQSAGSWTMSAVID